jgi:DNA-directed RNA polymerase subunit RPC12/RpoP
MSTTVKARYLPDLTEEEAMRIFKKHFAVEGERLEREEEEALVAELAEERGPDAPSMAGAEAYCPKCWKEVDRNLVRCPSCGGKIIRPGQRPSRVFEVFRPEGPNFKGFLVKMTKIERGELRERVAVCVQLVQAAGETSFEIAWYEPSKAKAAWEFLKEVAAGADDHESGHHQTEYEEMYEFLESRVARYIRNAPEFKDPNAKRGGCAGAGVVLILASPLLVVASLPVALMAPSYKSESCGGPPGRSRRFQGARQS